MLLPTLPPWPLIDPIIDRALEEDLAGGDVTTDACVPPDVRATATFVARTELVVAGLAVAERVFARVAPGAVEFAGRVADGTRARRGDALLHVSGLARALLMSERVALNLVQRMSGVATLTRAHVDALPAGSHTRVVDTRKTTPGLRILERYAVRCGGGHSHRDMLGSAVLIKDNHIVAAGGVRAAIERARAHAPHTSKVECEVETFAQLDEALAAGVDVLLLDNMDDATTGQALARIRAHQGSRVTVEASGGITLPRIRSLAELGVDVISVGALTHSAPAADVALDLRL
ncbi:MAG: carboxylating nicotinate-nucleotide diphosphorylase [Polyangiales bacterium]